MKGKWTERLFSLFLMVLAVSAYWQTVDLPRTETTTGLFTGPAFFPRWLSFLLFICSAIVFAKTCLPAKESPGLQGIPPSAVMVRVLSFLGVIGLALLATPWIGWLAAQFLMVGVIETVLERRKWPRALVISASAAAVIYLIFELGLGVRLPRGFWD